MTAIVGVCVIVLLAIVGVASSLMSATGPKHASTPAGDGGDAPPAHAWSHISFVDFDAKFCAASRLTDLQKDNAFAELKGQRVSWQGIASYVSEDSVGIKEKASTATYDVLIEVREDQRYRLKHINEGAQVRFDGVLDSYGTVLPHGLSDGVVQEGGVLSPERQNDFLLATERDVLQRAAANP